VEVLAAGRRSEFLRRRLRPPPVLAARWKVTGGAR